NCGPATARAAGGNASGTTAFGDAEPPLSARTATGKASTATREAKAMAERPPRLPQRALERDSPFDPRPHSALDRVPSERRARSCMYLLLPSVRKNWAHGPQSETALAETKPRLGVVR